MKVKKTSAAFNNYFGSQEKKHSLDSNMNANGLALASGGAVSATVVGAAAAGGHFDADRMPPPKVAR